jgi:serine/threonine protein phosphatase 1
VLSRLFRRNRQTANQLPLLSVPEGIRVYAIGDIHGRIDLFDALLARLDEDDASRTAKTVQLIFLGDLIDRGPDSASVVERVVRLAKHGDVRMLMGNHEEVWLAYLEGDTEILPSFTKMGGRETILSYGVSAEEFDNLPGDALLRRVRDCVPKNHIDMIRRFEDIIRVGDYTFVHAGIRPGLDIVDQKTEDLRWIREPFLSETAWFGSMIIHGHSVSAEVDEHPNRIGIDTGAFVSGRLTAIGIEGTERWFVSVDGEPGSQRYASRRTNSQLSRA